MDSGCIILTCLLLLQMIITLTMLNPVYDVAKITSYINTTTARYRSLYRVFIALYFCSVVYFGMLIPLQNMHTIIVTNNLDGYDKLILLSRIERNYIIAGFSLFLVIVIYGLKSLLSYTTALAQLMDPINEVENTKSVKKNENILPKLLKIKRSISYEAVLCTNELKEQLKLMMKNADHYNMSTLSNILATHVNI